MSITNHVGYQNAIQNYLDNFKEENVESNLLESFIEKVTIDGSESFSEKIFNIFKTISNYAPGKELMHRVVKSGQQLTVQEERVSSEITNVLYQTGCKAYPLMNLLMFRFDEKHYTLGLNQEGDKELFECPMEVVLFHECFHLVEHFENPNTTSLYESMFTQHKLIDPDFDSKNEQTTISGLSYKKNDLPSNSSLFTIKSNGDEYVFADLCCENSFRKALGYPMRINHKAITVPIGNTPNIIDMIALNALGNVKQWLLKSSELLNGLHSYPELPKMTLLSAAAYYAQSESLEFLLSKGARIDQEDEMGGPLMAVIKGRSLNLSDNWIPIAYKLLELGANTLMKDKDGKTALDLFEPDDLFCITKKPLIKLLKKAQKNVQSPLQF